MVGRYVARRQAGEKHESMSTFFKCDLNLVCFHTIISSLKKGSCFMFKHKQNSSLEVVTATVNNIIII